MTKSTFKTISLVFLLFYCLDSSAQSTADKIDGLLQTYYSTGRFIGTVAVSQKGKIICEKAFGYADLEWEIPNLNIKENPDMFFTYNSYAQILGKNR